MLLLNIMDEGSAFSDKHKVKTFGLSPSGILTGQTDLKYRIIDIKVCILCKRIPVQGMVRDGSCDVK